MLTVEQLSKHFKLSPTTVRRKAALGEIPSVRIGREYRFEWPDVWACERAKTPRAANEARYKLDLLEKGAIACSLAVSVRTVERWIADGMPTRNVFGSVRCNPIDVSEWLRGRGTDVAEGWWQQ